MIHIGFGQHAVTSLQHSFGKERVVGFPIDFSVGNIENLHTDAGIYAYFKWAQNVLKINKALQDEFFESLDLLKNASLYSNNEIVIWTCNNACEQIGFRFVCALLPQTQQDVYYINTAEAMKGLTHNRNTQIEVRHTGECSKNQLVTFLESARVLLEELQLITLAEEGFQLLQTNSMLRSYEQGQIIHEKETRDDELIKRLIREHSKFIFKPNVPKIVGELYATNYHYVSDSWYYYRVNYLLKSKVK